MTNTYEKRLKESRARQERSEEMNLEELVPYMHDLLEKWNASRKVIAENTSNVDLRTDASRRLRKAQSDFHFLGPEVLTCLFTMKKLIRTSSAPNSFSRSVPGAHAMHSIAFRTCSSPSPRPFFAHPQNQLVYICDIALMQKHGRI